MNIFLSQSDESPNLFPMMGIFHMTTIALHCVGKNEALVLSKAFDVSITPLFGFFRVKRTEYMETKQITSKAITNCRVMNTINPLTAEFEEFTNECNEKSKMHKYIENGSYIINLIEMLVAADRDDTLEAECVSC